MKATYVVGDTLAVLPTLDPGSVDCVITSPPFLALRSYLPADHADKALEHGSEPTPAAFLSQLLDVTELLGRALTPHGSIAVELGDSFAGSGGAGGDYNPGGWREGQEAFTGTAYRELDGTKDTRVIADGHAQPIRNLHGKKQPGGRGWPLPKSLCLTPSLYAASLAYGRNLLALPGTPEWREFAPWRVRNLIAWVRPNPPVGALGDKWRPATSYITVATRSATRYWDDIPTRRPPTKAPQRNFVSNEYAPSGQGARKSTGRLNSEPEVNCNPAGAPLLDWWEITPTGFTSRLGAHYATFPDAIAIPLVEAMCPRRVCRTCGVPSRRLTETTGYSDKTGRDRSTDAKSWNSGGPNGNRASSVGRTDGGIVAQLVTTGWTSCGCPGTEQTREDGFHEGDGWRPGLVLDPYCGTGTTLLVATGHGRDAIGVDLDERNAWLAEERLGMFLQVVGPETAA